MSQKTSLPKRAIIYTRVSTDVQSVENQLRQLRERAARSGWSVIAEECDEAITGRGHRRLPARERVLAAVYRREADVVLAWSVDRLGRSIQQVVAFCDDLLAAGVDLVLHQQAFDTTTPTGRAMFGMVAVFAEFEAALISERTRAGLERARAAGKRLGRPPLPAEKLERVRSALAAGKSVRAAAAIGGVSVGAANKLRRASPLSFERG